MKIIIAINCKIIMLHVNSSGLKRAAYLVSALILAFLSPTRVVAPDMEYPKL